MLNLHLIMSSFELVRIYVFKMRRSWSERCIDRSHLRDFFYFIFIFHYVFSTDVMHSVLNLINNRALCLESLNLLRLFFPYKDRFWTKWAQFSFLESFCYFLVFEFELSDLIFKKSDVLSITFSLKRDDLCEEI